ncbi:predicted protein [Sclerotinia sclerotiorum 1980 UF-70]|uniref:Uncharacterized protein n=1 Tax=Sclerotinia sclerotiorum (strain ATCC 18683 / 1980 / Ss-1) TaxID=665079 RepID=A7F0Z9_SCLS1|nr:predicted protein [Sclerotinia sclerotiorum 1980 UF-70]EDN95391.1 predicted protein [Sclerotinia sclerotiorum 1980 UF-70]
MWPYVDFHRLMAPSYQLQMFELDNLSGLYLIAFAIWRRPHIDTEADQQYTKISGEVIDKAEILCPLVEFSPASFMKELGFRKASVIYTLQPLSQSKAETPDAPWRSGDVPSLGMDEM